MIFECSKCGRQREKSAGQSGDISHGYCAHCYLLFSEINGGLDWRNLSVEERNELKEDIRRNAIEEKNLTGIPRVEWPHGGDKFVNDMISEIVSETERNDGIRK